MEYISNMKKLYTLLLFLATCAIGFSQSKAPFCATKTYVDQVLERTDLSDGEKSILIDAYRQEESQLMKRMADRKKSDTLITIPMVFHLVHYYGAEAIPNKTVYATLNLLNREFNKKNAPTANVVAPFKSFIGDCRIEFKLATIDPQGNCTSGIVRHVDDTLANCNSLECNLKMKTKYMWPRDNYMNMMICASIQASGGGIVQGFSHFPFAPFSNADTIDCNAMIASVLPTNLNDQGGGNTSVTTHEVGHWLGLYHTWGKSDNVAIPENCNDDDDVRDTPNCVGLQSVCTLNANTCNQNLPNDTIDNTQNFMDYSHCYAMFTEGQAARVRYVLENVPHRRNCVTGANMTKVGADYPYSDWPTFLCKADFMPNYDYTREVICPGMSVTFSDLSYHAVTSRKWTFQGGNPTIATDSLVSVKYDVPGEYSVTLEVKNGGSTELKTITKMIKVVANGSLGTSYSQGFESIDLNNTTDLDVINPNNDVTFEVSNAAGTTGSKSLYIHNSQTTAIGRVDAVESNTIDLSGQTNIFLDFKYAFTGRPDSLIRDEFNVYVSVDCGRTWQKRKAIKSTALTTATAQSGEFVPTLSEWKSTSIALNAYNKPNLRFKLEFTSGGGNNFYLDDLRIYSTTGITEDQALAQELSLSPNPSSGLSDLSFSLNTTTSANIYLSDLTGRVVNHIHTGKLEAGEHSFKIDATQLQAGVYLVNLETGNQKLTQKLIVQ